jgi:hypothetical protein
MILSFENIASPSSLCTLFSAQVLGSIRRIVVVQAHGLSVSRLGMR